MDSQFWVNAWNEGRTNFHLSEVNAKLTQFFPSLEPKQGQKVLVPLCGKSKDLIWLHELGLEVHGVELHEPAIEAFFAENGLGPITKTQEDGFTSYTYKNMKLGCGDFFQFNETEAYDFVYDRAALVALPAHMRKNYVEVVKRATKVGGKCLLITCEYDQSKLEGPPFSVETREIHELYEDVFSVKLLESKRPSKLGPRFEALDSFIQKVYILEKRQS